MDPSLPSLHPDEHCHSSEDCQEGKGLSPLPGSKLDSSRCRCRCQGCHGARGTQEWQCAENNCKLHHLVCTAHLEANVQKRIPVADLWSKRGKIFSAVTAMNLSKAKAQNNSVVELNLKEATESLKSQAKSSKIVDLPDGDPLFMFSFIPGKTRDLNIFWDTGCSHLMMKTDVPVKELQAVRTRKGPLTIKGAGDTAIKVGDEWVVLVPKEDGSQQMLIGVTSPQIAAPFPVFNTQEAFKELQE